MNTVLVTGHTGFIGRALGAALKAREIKWCGASRSNGFDLEDPDSIKRLPDTDVIVHLAGLCSVKESWERPSDFFRANVLSTINVLELARRSGASMIFASTYLYGQPTYQPIDESHPIALTNPYAWSKRQAESAVEFYADAFSVRSTILRLFNVYGPGQNSHHLIPTILQQGLTGDTISLADLSPKRDYLWIGDLCNAFLSVLSQPRGDASGGSSDVYNIGTGHSHSVAEVVEIVQTIIGPRHVIDRGEVRPGETLDCICDSSNFQKTLNWTPKVTLDQGLATMLRPPR